ncbi:MAG TPA: UDP-N-acetylglucosamine 4,6-dehydratase (inverting) [Candidatus Omnitrophica bacterium]|nr:UDP-N-acetylglucosamine 4,6-dehydratase (inverting) [Candidatus Omnitrophota bacterium]
MNWKDKVVLVTGGTGSFGQKFVEIMLKNHKPKKLIVFSRDELKQFQMRQRIQLEFGDSPLRYFIGDIRDKERVYRAVDGVDVVVHASALKQIPSCEYNPFEAVKTNILGAQNIINAAIDKGVKKVIALSTDKAVNPINLYGATKLAMEKLFIAGNAYVGAKPTCFSAVRYGNVVGSRGSVIPFFLSLIKKGTKELPITDERMTRFWITLDQSVSLVLRAVEESVGGEIFTPRVPSMRIIDLAKALEPNCKFRITGLRPGEKLHETLISEEEGRKTKILDKEVYVILPDFRWREGVYGKYERLPSVPEGFIYRSDSNDKWLSSDELRKMVKELKIE